MFACCLWTYSPSAKPSTSQYCPYCIQYYSHQFLAAILHICIVCYLNLISYIFICWAWTTSRGFMTAQQKVKDVYERYENSSLKFVRISYVFKQYREEEKRKTKKRRERDQREIEKQKLFCSPFVFVLFLANAKIPFAFITTRTTWLSNNTI